MTPEFGAASQLEKIDMLDFADVVAINKFERRGGADALRDVRRQLVRNREAFGASPTRCRCSAPSPRRFNDDGVTALYQHLRRRCSAEHGPAAGRGRAPGRDRPGVDRARRRSSRPRASRYLAEIAETVRGYHAADGQAGRGGAPGAAARPPCRLSFPADSERRAVPAAARRRARAAARRRHEASAALLTAGPRSPSLLGRRAGGARPGPRAAHRADPRVAVGHPGPAGGAAPRFTDHGELLRFLRDENLPGYFPFTAGVFPFKREGEDPARMFAGEGDAVPHQPPVQAVCRRAAPATRLSTAFDSVTLYGLDPGERPDIYGKVGNSGVSIATLDDMKVLYDGFDLRARPRRCR